MKMQGDQPLHFHLIIIRINLCSYRGYALSKYFFRVLYQRFLSMRFIEVLYRQALSMRFIQVLYLCALSVRCRTGKRSGMRESCRGVSYVG
ncbi:MAG: hypothetical protein Q4D81_01225 [Eubacteriales bacterium]|nr:hypothetical protein [Eubacteriales bacterium]